MRFATILPRASIEPVPVADAPDGTWIELAGLIGREAVRLEQVLPWLMVHGAHVPGRAQSWRGPRYRESEFSFLAPVVRPPAFREFHDSVIAACGGSGGRGLNVMRERDAEPAFSFLNHNSLIGHNAAVAAPFGCAELDCELELGVVIGHGGRDIPAERAWGHVAGFTIVNGLSARDWERREMAAGFGPAKARDFATAVGPWMIPRDEVADRIEGERLTLDAVAMVNGRELSRGGTAGLRHSIPRMIAHASRDVELFPGELIGAGPVAVGLIREGGSGHPGGGLKPGDVVELQIERIGLLRTRIVSRC